MLGIYELKGDTLKLCFDTNRNTRPKEFKTTPKSGFLLAVYQRAKQPQTEGPDLSGVYDCEGMQFDGKKYKAKVEIERLGDAYSVTWAHGLGRAHLGIGIRKGNLLSVCFAARTQEGVMTGIAVYEIDKDAKLHGDWTELGGVGIVQTETLTPQK
jgi:hypothetical protein